MRRLISTIALATLTPACQAPGADPEDEVSSELASTCTALELEQLVGTFTATSVAGGLTRLELRGNGTYQSQGAFTHDGRWSLQSCRGTTRLRLNEAAYYGRTLRTYGLALHGNALHLNDETASPYAFFTMTRTSTNDQFGLPTSAFARAGEITFPPQYAASPIRFRVRGDGWGTLTLAVNTSAGYLGEQIVHADGTFFGFGGGHAVSYLGHLEPSGQLVVTTACFAEDTCASSAWSGTLGTTLQ